MSMSRMYALVLALLLLAAQPSESMDTLNPKLASSGSGSGSPPPSPRSPRSSSVHAADEDVQVFASLPCPGTHCPAKGPIVVPDTSPLSFKSHPRTVLGADLWQNKWCTQKGSYDKQVDAQTFFLHGTNGFAVSQSARYTGLRMAGIKTLAKVGLAAVGGEGVAVGEQDYDSNAGWLFVTQPDYLPAIIPPLAYADRAVTSYFVPRRPLSLSASGGGKHASPLQTWLASLSEQQYTLYRKISLIPVVVMLTMGENAEVDGVGGSSIPGEIILTCGDIQAIGVGASYTFDETNMDNIPQESMKLLHTAEENAALLRRIVGHYIKHTVAIMPVEELVTNLAKCKAVNKRLDQPVHPMFRPHMVKELVGLQAALEKMKKPSK